MQQYTDLLLSLLTNIPVWAIFLFFLYRSVKNRDTFEREASSNNRKLVAQLNQHGTAIALLKNDTENLKETIKSVNLVLPSMEKFKIDLDLYYKRLRDLEKRNGV